MGADLFVRMCYRLAAMVPEINVIKRHGGAIQGCLCGIGLFIAHRPLLAFGIIFSNIGTMLVKIKKNDAKEKGSASA